MKKVKSRSLSRRGRRAKQVMILLLLLSGLNLVFSAPCGDVNSDGSINIIDALMTAQFYVGLNPANFDQTSADVSGDSTINIVDALQIAQYYVGLLESFPGCVPTNPPPGPSGPGDYDTNVPVGWAVVPGYGIQTTTGGGGGEVVTATSGSQLASYASGDTPRIIRVQGTLSGSNVNVGSNKTIIGVGADAKISGFYLNMGSVQNIIIRNLTISGGTDAIAARYTDHLWIDHVDTFSCSDGLIDITRESDHYTVSRVRFSKHHKTMLLNGGSTHSSDAGKLNGTVHHCWFDGSDTRNPRAGFGMIHVLNNLYNNNDYCIGLHTDCKVVAERNYFRNTSDCIHQMYTFDKNHFEYGSAISIDNIFDNSSGDDSDGIGFTVTNYYLFDFMSHPAADVPANVQGDVGPDAAYGEIGLMPIPGQGAVGVTNGALSWKTGTYSVSSYNVYFGTTTNPPHVANTTSTSYNAGSLNSGVTYYWAVDQVLTNGTTRAGKLWTFKAQ